MLWKVGSGEVKFTLDAGAPIVDIRDVAEAAVLAEKHRSFGERYIIANEFISNREFLIIAAGHCGNKPPRVIPLWVAYGMAWVVERIFRLIGRKDYLVSTDAVYLSNAFQELDNSKARRELHWEPRPVEETIRDALGWYAKRKAEATGIR